ncbi:suppressor of fused domain protein [Oceanivirga salmonicida]|uniref:suppressor of fused domain protein n=1 Tax=Oceanivirga salmonicida TaxID=1769291 RepID=UPI00082A2943|nr:suppressor of fused domain protein [Oceanivirga salmonicida]
MRKLKLVKKIKNMIYGIEDRKCIHEYINNIYEIDYVYDTDVDDLKIYISNPSNDKDYYKITTEGFGKNKVENIYGIDSRIELEIFLSKKDMDKINNIYEFIIEMYKGYKNKKIDIVIGDVISDSSIISKLNTNAFKDILILKSIEDLSINLPSGEDVKYLQLVPILEIERRFIEVYEFYTLLDYLDEKKQIKDFVVLDFDREVMIEIEEDEYSEEIIKLENENQIVKFKSKGFEKIVRKLYGLEGKIYHKDIGYRKSFNLMIKIKDFENKINSIDLDNAFHSLEDFKWFTNLEELCLEYEFDKMTTIKGDVADLKKLKNLKKLNLSGTDIKGEISSIKDLDLVELETSFNLSGNVKDLINFKNLKLFKNFSLYFKGRHKDLNKLPSLETLHLLGGNIEGNTKDLSNLINLKKLSLEGLNTEGNIKYLKKLENLNELVLDFVDVDGDLESLEELENLKVLEIKSTNINMNKETKKRLKNKLDWALFEEKGRYMKDIFYDDEDELDNLDCFNIENDEFEYFDEKLYKKTKKGLEYIMLSTKKGNLKVTRGIVGSNVFQVELGISLKNAPDYVVKKLGEGYSFLYELGIEGVLVFESELTFIDMQELDDLIEQYGLGQVLFSLDYDKVAVAIVDIAKTLEIVNKEFKIGALNFYITSGEKNS